MDALLLPSHSFGNGGGSISSVDRIDDRPYSSTMNIWYESLLHAVALSILSMMILLCDSDYEMGRHLAEVEFSTSASLSVLGRAAPEAM